MTTEASNAAVALDDVDRYKTGDQQAFLRLWERHRDSFAGRLHRLLAHDEHAVEDLLQDAAVKLLTPVVRENYDRSKPWDCWAFKVLRNLAVDYLRRRVRGREVVFDVESLNDPDLDVGEDGFAGDLHTCLARLPNRFRELMVQRYLEDRQQTEIARDMALSTATVSKNLDKARTLLARCLEEKGHGDRLR